MNSAPRSVARTFVDALLGHDEAAAFALFDAEATITVAGRNVLAGSFGSPAHFQETRRWLFLEHDAGIDMIRCDVFLDQSEVAIALVEERAHRGVNDLVYRSIYIFALGGGVIRDLRIVPEDPYALDAFWE